MTDLLRRLAFSVSILAQLLEEHPSSSFGVLYDIGCNMAAHVRKVRHPPSFL
jgi:hypothetical protein